MQQERVLEEVGRLYLQNVELQAIVTELHQKNQELQSQLNPPEGAEPPEEE